MEFCELKVPVPWGHIAVKAWGDSTNEAVIVLHGLVDNAGSFDTLVPLLPPSFYYLCVDLPGHGFSTHFSPGLPIHFTDFLYAVKLIVAHFERKQYIFIGHSFGGRVSIVFAQLYPQIVSKLAVLDVGYLLPNPPDRYMSSIIDSFASSEKISSFKSDQTPNYTYEEIVNRVMVNRFLGRLTYETAEQLVNRMVKKIGEDKYEMTYDLRLRSMLNPLVTKKLKDELWKKYPLKCPGIAVYWTETKKSVNKNFRALLYLPGFKGFVLDGDHHSHHTKPALVSPILTSFLLKRKSKI